MLEYLGAATCYQERLANFAGELGGHHRATPQVEEIRIGPREVIQVQDFGEKCFHDLHGRVHRTRGVLLLQDRGDGVRHIGRRQELGGERYLVGHDEVRWHGVTRHAPNGRLDRVGTIDIDQVANEGEGPPRMRDDDEPLIVPIGQECGQLALDVDGVQIDAMSPDGNVEGGALRRAHRLERALCGIHVVRELRQLQTRS